jgi:hypothetical protein
VGRVAWVALEGPGHRVTHLVVSTAARFGRLVRVPLAAIDPDAAGGALAVRLTSAETAALPARPAISSVVPPGGWLLPGTYVAVLGAAPPRGETTGGGANALTAPPSVRLGTGTAVLDRWGTGVGVAAGVCCDPARGQVQGFLLRLGGGLRTLFGGGREVEVPAPLVGRVTEGALWLAGEHRALTAGARAVPVGGSGAGR